MSRPTGPTPFAVRRIIDYAARGDHGQQYIFSTYGNYPRAKMQVPGAFQATAFSVTTSPKCPSRLPRESRRPAKVVCSNMGTGRVGGRGC